MTIKEVEEKTGLTRSNVRFYEKKNSLIHCEMKKMVTEIILKKMWMILKKSHSCAHLEFLLRIFEMLYQKEPLCLM